MVSLLDIVAAADNFPYPSKKTSDLGPEDRYVPFYLTAEDYLAGLTPIGLLRAEVLAALKPFLSTEVNYEQTASLARPLVRAQDKGPSDVGALYFGNDIVRDGLMPTVMDNIISDWKGKGLFPRQLGGQSPEGSISASQLKYQARKQRDVRCTPRQTRPRSKRPSRTSHSARLHSLTFDRAGAFLGSSVMEST
jgi:hypothetical protein